MTAFDPYYEWLSIPPEEQPANFYRLLGLKVLEANANVISNAADRQMAHVRTFAMGPNGGIAQRILNELANARVMLLEPARKTAYDAMLQSAQAEQQESQTNLKQTADKQESLAEKGVSFGDYVVLQPISIGAMGHVYKARRKADGVIVSLKVIPKKLAGSEQFLKRLQREFNITSAIQHPNVVAGYELSEAHGHPFLAFEYVGGADLERLLVEHGPLSVANAIEITKRIAEGLAYLHKKGVVHRNIKPQSILVNVQGTVKIANLTMAVEEDARAFLGGRENNLTTMGQTIGTVDYLPPEQAVDSHNVDGRADLYALGCTLHHLLIGKPPFKGRNAMEILKAHKSDPIPSLCKLRKDVPESLDELFQKLLAKRPADRPASAEEVVEMLNGREEKKWDRTVLVAGGVAIAVVLFLGALVIFSRK
jgi:serine/threonine protein kinase